MYRGKMLVLFSVLALGTTHANPFKKLLSLNSWLAAPELHNVHHALATAAYVDYYDIQGAMIEHVGKWHGTIFEADRIDRKEIDTTLRRLCINPKELRVLFSTTSKIHHCCTPKRIFLNEQEYDLLSQEEKEFLLAHIVEHIKHYNLARKVLNRTIVSLGVDVLARSVNACIPATSSTTGLIKKIAYEILDTSSFLLSSKWVQLGLGMRLSSWSTQINEADCDREAAANLHSAQGGIGLLRKHRAPRLALEWPDQMQAWVLHTLLPTQCWTQETNFDRMQRLWELQAEIEKA